MTFHSLFHCMIEEIKDFASNWNEYADKVKVPYKLKDTISENLVALKLEK